MATQPRFDTSTVTPDVHRGDGDGRRVQHDGRHADQDERQMRDLLKQLAGEGGDLVRNEIALAKLEIRDMAREMAIGSAKVGAAIALALAGALSLIAAAIIGLGTLLDGRYALSALIVGAVVLLVGGLLARSGMASLKNPPKPEETARTMQDNKAWAAREVREFKDEIRS
jgi:uncharacterized membrane protein YqjE